MTGLDISKYIKNPNLINSIDVTQLKDLIKNYPYYQAGHILLLKYLKENSFDEFQQQLPKSSIHISNRDLLLNFLNTELTQEEDVSVSSKEEIKSENNIEKTEPVEQHKSDTDKNTEEPETKQKVLLKNKNVKRKINDTFEGMGQNISETISSQLEFAVVKDKDKLEYPSEIYFIDEERNGKNNIITIDANPDKSAKTETKKDILTIDENQNIDKEEEEVIDPETDAEEAFELIENEPDEQNEKKVKQTEYFDINSYADETTLTKDNDLISRFIEKNPRIEPKEIKEEIEDISEKSVEEDSNLLSETLIKVYIKQGLFEKAIESYRKLSLKYPEKSAYFASQIKNLEDKINKQ